VEGQALHVRHNYDLKTPDVDKIVSNAWLKAGKSQKLLNL